jgi:hypothetical protein
MRRLIVTTLATLVICGVGATGTADDGAKAVLDKAIRALGGEAKLSKAKGISWTSRGTFTFGGNESAFTSKATVAGLDRLHQDWEIDFKGNTIRTTNVIDGDQGWRRFGDMSQEIEKSDLVDEKRVVFLQVIVTTILPLKGKEFKIESADEEKVADSDAVGIKVTSPDGKDFKLFFDKTSGLPAKLAAKVSYMGSEFEQETTYGDYKDFSGVKAATKIEARRDGEKWLDAEVTELKLLPQVDPKLFAEP